MGAIVPVDTSALYGESEQSILDHSMSIMAHLVKRYNDPEELNRMSIDKTDSVLRVVDSATKIVTTMANTKLRLMAMHGESDDRGRLLSILTNMDLRTKYNSINSSRTTELDDDDIVSANVTTIRGELTDGVEQLSMELLDYEREVSND